MPFYPSLSVSLSCSPLAFLGKDRSRHVLRDFHQDPFLAVIVTGWGSLRVAGGGEGGQNSSLARGYAVLGISPGPTGEMQSLVAVAEG